MAPQHVPHGDANVLRRIPGAKLILSALQLLISTSHLPYLFHIPQKKYFFKSYFPKYLPQYLVPN